MFLSAFYFKTSSVMNWLCSESHVLSAVILVPARELALQTAQVCKELGKHLNIQVVVLTGGTNLRDDILRLGQTVHVIVATPGRLLDLAEKNIAILFHATMLVLDEADKLLSMDFSSSMDGIIARMAKGRQIMLFSATFPITVLDFKKKHLTSPHEINLMKKLTLDGVSQFFAYVDERQKLHCLNTLFSRLQVSTSRWTPLTVSHSRLDQPIYYFLQQCFAC